MILYMYLKSDLIYIYIYIYDFELSDYALTLISNQ